MKLVGLATYQSTPIHPPEHVHLVIRYDGGLSAALSPLKPSHNIFSIRTHFFVLLLSCIVT